MFDQIFINGFRFKLFLKALLQFPNLDNGLTDVNELKMRVVTKMLILAKAIIVTPANVTKWWLLENLKKFLCDS